MDTPAHLNILPGCDFTASIAKLTLLFRDCEPGILEDLRESIASLTPERLGNLLLNFAEPAYLSMEGTANHVAGLRFSFPGRANELLAALRASEGNKDTVIAHDALLNRAPP
jgi:hypothetical protein